MGDQKHHLPIPNGYIVHHLKAHHKKKCLGHWVVMKETIAGVDLFACAYAWSQSFVSYFLSTTDIPRPGKMSPLTLGIRDNSQ
eukprot:14014138-Ditylum_brightwellii.AAC.1